MTGLIRYEAARAEPEDDLDPARGMLGSILCSVSIWLVIGLIVWLS